MADVPWRETLVTIEVASGAPIQVELSVDGLTLAAQSREEVLFFDERGKEQKSLDLAAWGNPR